MDYFLFGLFIFCLAGIIAPFILLPGMLAVGKWLLRPKAEQYAIDIRERPFVSLLVCAYNEEKVIEAKLENLLALDYPNDLYEIIIASDGSDDQTNRIVESFQKHHKQVRLLNWQEREGKVNVINKSIPSCLGDIIILSDANAFCNDQCITRIIKHFQCDKVGVVAGEKRIHHIGNSKHDDLIGKSEGLYWKIESFIKGLESLWGKVIGADGAIYGIRKETFSPAPSGTSVDDFLISMMILERGWQIKYEPNAYVVEEATNALITEFRRKCRIAAGQYYNLIRLRKLLNIFNYGWVSVLYVMHKLSRLFSPFLFLYITIFTLFNLSDSWAFIFFVCLCSSYLVAVVGYVAHEKFQIKQKVVHLITYYYLTVFAQGIGLWKHILGQQKAIWEKQR